jgi:signal transduction histidine kinase
MRALHAFPRSRSGARVGDAFDTVGVQVRRLATQRVGLYASILAVLTGLGLYFAAGVRGAESWSIFVLASVGGVVGATAGIRFMLGVPQSSATEPALSVGVDPTAEQPSRPVDSGPDDVDYLMALRHEFRTPLNAVLGFSDVLLSGIDGEVNESQREDLEIIRASGIRLRILLDSALDLSQLTDGELRLDADRADVRELVARVAVEAGQLWSNKRTAGCTLPEGACVAVVDEARLRRSILVLADFLATDHREANIALSLAVSDGHVAIEVTADPSDRLSLTAIPTPAEVLASEEASEIRRWPVAVTSEVIARHEGSLYHGDAPSRFLIRLPLGEQR